MTKSWKNLSRPKEEFFESQKRANGFRVNLVRKGDCKTKSHVGSTESNYSMVNAFWEQ